MHSHGTHLYAVVQGPQGVCLQHPYVKTSRWPAETMNQTLTNGMSFMCGDWGVTDERQAYAALGAARDGCSLA